MSIGTVTSLLLATALTVAIANVGQRLRLVDMASGQSDCGTNPGAACAATPRAEFQGSRCSLPADRDIRQPPISIESSTAMAPPNLNQPLVSSPSAGTGLNRQHAQDILERQAAVDFLDVRGEDYMGAGGPPHSLLRLVRQRYPVSVHGAGLSLGSTQPLDRAHIRRVRSLIDRYQPFLLSEYLGWSAHDGMFFHEPLPLPYNNEVLDRVSRRIDEVQQLLGLVLLIENPPAYVTFEASTLSEVAFLRGLVHRTGCCLVLDLGHIYVSAVNQQFEPMDYIDAFPLEHVRKIHLSGHSKEIDDDGSPLLIDDHSSAVPDTVWALYRRVLARIGPLPTVVKWDKDVPSFSTLAAELALARGSLQAEASRRARRVA